MRAALRGVVGVEILIYMMGRVCASSGFFDQPRSQGSLLPAPMERERERDPGRRWSRGFRTKLFLREESFVSHFFVWFIRDVHAVIATAR